MNVDPNWMQRGLCYGVPIGANIWLSAIASRQREAKAVCLTCPVCEQCLVSALAEEGLSCEASRGGIRGALDERERLALARKLRRKVPA